MVYFADFNGIWLGGHAVVVAETEQEAREMVERAAKHAGVEDPGEITLYVIHTRTPGVTNLYNGDY